MRFVIRDLDVGRDDQSALVRRLEQFVAESEQIVPAAATPSRPPISRHWGRSWTSHSGGPKKASATRCRRPSSWPVPRRGAGCRGGQRVRGGVRGQRLAPVAEAEMDAFRRDWMARYRAAFPADADRARDVRDRRRAGRNFARSSGVSGMIFKGASRRRVRRGEAAVRSGTTGGGKCVSEGIEETMTSDDPGSGGGTDQGWEELRRTAEEALRRPSARTAPIRTKATNWLLLALIVVGVVGFGVWIVIWLRQPVCPRRADPAANARGEGGRLPETG